MRFESAIELQADVFSKVFNFEELPVATASVSNTPLFVDPYLMEPGKSEQRARASSRRRVVEDIALGISAEDPNSDSKLAVLVQNRMKVSSHEVDLIQEMARGEAEIVYIGRQHPFWTRTRNAPLRLGCSVSPSTVGYSGTLGCFCRDNQTGKEGILSNNHVFADVNQVPAGTPIIQQAAGDSGNFPRDAVGKLERYVPIQFGGFPNAVDAAFAVLDQHGRGEDRQTIFDNASPPGAVANCQPANKVQAYPGMPVMKTGRTTGHTLGRVRAINVNNLVVNMGVGIARFDGQIAFEMDASPPSPFGLPGDSGSLIVDRLGRPTALLFSGSQSGGAGNLGIVHGCPILSVEAQLNVSLI